MVHIWVIPWSRYDPIHDTIIIPAVNAEYLKDPFASNLLFTSIGASITLFILFILLSTAPQRKSLMFYLHLVSFCLLVTSCAFVLVCGEKIEAIFDIEAINTDTLESSIQFLSISFVMEKITCVVADLALFLRLWHYHPSVLYTRQRRWLRLGPLVLLTPPRVVLGFVYTKYSGIHDRVIASKINLAEFLVQMAYCLYATVLLLSMSIKFYLKTTRREDRRLKRELRLLIESILCTFLVPLIFQIICIYILLQYQDPWTHNFRFYNSCNTFLTVQSAILSTTWSSIRGFTDDKDRETPALGLVKIYFTSKGREGQETVSKDSKGRSEELIGLETLLRD